MANVTTKGFTDLVQSQVAAIQSRATGLLDFTIGSIIRSFVEAVALVALWLQGLILALLATTRAATSAGADLDSWMADYSLTRLQAQAAEGQVTFGRYSTTLQAVLLPGATVQSADGSQDYTVITDTTNGAWSAALGGYVAAAGVASIAVPVAANTAGSAGNAATGAVNVITSSTPGFDFVSNGAPFTGGDDAESDQAFRARFQQYLLSLSKATLGAVGNAITSIQQGVVYTLTENQTYAGVAEPGHFSIVVDDGSGAPPTSFLNSVSSAVDLVRPIGSTFEVHAPTVETVTIAMNIAVAAGYTKATVATLVQGALIAYVNSLGLGVSLPWSRLAQVAYDTSAGVTNVSAVTLNGGTADLAASSLQVIKTDVAHCTVNAP